MKKETSHDHFLTCNKTLAIKTKRIAKVMKLLQQWHTPPQLRHKIIMNLRMIYEMDHILDSLTLTWTETEQISGETNQIIESETEIG